MKKIGTTLFTLLAVSTSACAESPTASAAGAEAALSGWMGSDVRVEEDPALGFTGHDEGVGGTEDASVMTTTETARNPGLAGSGH